MFKSAFFKAQYYASKLLNNAAAQSGGTFLLALGGNGGAGSGETGNAIEWIIRKVRRGRR